MIPIQFSVCLDGNIFESSSYTGEYRNLMVLLKDKFYPDGFGECGGQGKCGTCLIKIPESSLSYPHNDRNETTTLTKMKISDQGVRLACQVLVTQKLNNLCIYILDNEAA